MATFSELSSTFPCQTAGGDIETDPSVMDGYDPDLILAEHLVHDCGTPTFWALSTLAAHGRA